MKCPDCDGTGKITLLTSVETCKKCGGSGEVEPSLIKDAIAAKIAEDAKMVPTYYPDGSVVLKPDEPIGKVLADYVANGIPKPVSNQEFFSSIAEHVETEMTIPVYSTSPKPDPFRPDGALGKLWDYYKQHIPPAAHHIAKQHVKEIVDDGMKFVGIAPQSEWPPDPDKMKVKDIREEGLYWMRANSWWAICVFRGAEDGLMYAWPTIHPAKIPLDHFISEFRDRDCRRIEEPAK